MDIIKTRPQLHGHGGSTNPTSTASALRVALGIVRNEGFLGLYWGLSSAIIRHLIYTPIRIVGYANLRDVVVAAQGRDGGGGSLSLPSKALVGGISGVMAQVCRKGSLGAPAEVLPCDQRGYGFESWNHPVQNQVAASPADLIKVRMQADGRLVSQGLQPRYSGFLDALNKVICSEGLQGLWRGVFPNAQSAFLGLQLQL